jgi:hypothetical protein
LSSFPYSDEVAEFQALAVIGLTSAAVGGLLQIFSSGVKALLMGLDLDERHMSVLEQG